MLRGGHPACIAGLPPRSRDLAVLFSKTISSKNSCAIFTEIFLSKKKVKKPSRRPLPFHPTQMPVSVLLAALGSCVRVCGFRALGCRRACLWFWEDWTGLDTGARGLGALAAGRPLAWLPARVFARWAGQQDLRQAQARVACGHQDPGDKEDATSRVAGPYPPPRRVQPRPRPTSSLPLGAW